MLQSAPLTPLGGRRDGSLQDLPPPGGGGPPLTTPRSPRICAGLLVNATAAIASGLTAFLRLRHSSPDPEADLQAPRLTQGIDLRVLAFLALVAGVLRGYHNPTLGSGESLETGVALSNRVLNKVLSPNGAHHAEVPESDPHLG